MSVSGEDALSLHYNTLMTRSLCQKPQRYGSVEKQSCMWYTYKQLQSRQAVSLELYLHYGDVMSCTANPEHCKNV